jgi:formate dehydrogenase iron-sulfur subunit
MNRRDFLKQTGLFLAGGMLLGTESAHASEHGAKIDPNALGVLVDTTLCIGCRQCELGCDRWNKLTNPPKPDAEFDDKSVFGKHRYYKPDQYTVVNKHEGENGKPVFVKTQCMHCAHPSCVSACIVGALTKKPAGPVHYEYWKCLGCRYCMMACPFQVPCNEFANAFTPHIRKCTFCFDRILKEDGSPNPGGTPACAEACPMGVMTFGKRANLIEVARDRLNRNPEKYVDHIYGESEIEGTSWMYLAGVPFEQLGFPALKEVAPATVSETIMHSAFKHWIPPLSLYAILGTSMWMFGRKAKDEQGNEEKNEEKAE